MARTATGGDRRHARRWQTVRKAAASAEGDGVRAENRREKRKGRERWSSPTSSGRSGKRRWRRRLAARRDGRAAAAPWEGVERG
uniref:Uncharacterized protein n=2 Tax=Oryza sativa subsp. japonica TaxID=39947 RepID=Q53JF5_ORYSJ|nr:hypothetical protein LOC_Os11g26210 [Oryza sativa Japonica Group]ABA93410.1 hypothetical protein LOC_Os11g26210 [Oryza sativa Japonica Group]